MDLKIREIQLDDAEAIEALYKNVESLHRQALPARFREPPADYLSGLLRESANDQNTKIFVADTGDEILGYLRVMIKEMPNHPMIHPGKYISVEELSVSPRARRQKVGARLMRFAEDFARQSGFSEIELNVWKFNEGAEKFYLALGYQPTRTYFAKKLSD